AVRYGFKLEGKSATHTTIGVPDGPQQRLHRTTDAESKHLSFLGDRLEEYSCEGLRTLAFAMRLLDRAQWEEFMESYRFVMSISSSDREQLLSQKADEIETELELLGVTGIGDRLQEGVEETIIALRGAGMQGKVSLVLPYDTVGKGGDGKVCQDAFEGRTGTEYTYQLFAINTIDGIWQAAVVFFASYLTFTGQECGLWLFGFYIASGMMFTNTAHLAVEVRCWNFEGFECVAGSIYPMSNPGKSVQLPSFSLFIPQELPI
ncbi:hypothetical protein TELCIR_01479, partial [Teladorsagia circumcincta]